MKFLSFGKQGAKLYSVIVCPIVCLKKNIPLCTLFRSTTLVQEEDILFLKWSKLLKRHQEGQ